MVNYIIVFIICFAGSIIQGAASFGFALFVMPLLTILIPLKDAAILSAMSALVIGIWVCISIRKHLKIGRIIVPLTVGVLVMPLGVYILTVCNEGILKKLLGAFIVLLSIVFFTNPVQRVNFKENGITKVIVGIISGLLAGMLNIGGPPQVIYYVNTIKEKMEYKAALEFSFVIFSIVTILVHMAYGNMERGIISYVPLCLVAVVSGTIIGMKVFIKLDQNALKKGIYIMMAVLGLMLIVR